jgi:pimeloyl-ACP methyl ester carboxylesterase
MARFAQRHPEAVEKLVVMNVPHGRAFKEHLSSSLSQLMKSWYVFYFQLPYLPELKLAQYVPASTIIVQPQANRS